MSENILSVIIPNYNNALFLEKCIDSVLKQSFKQFEIIIVDDCSTDNSIEIIRKLQRDSDRITLIALEQNGGVSNARNVGLYAAKTPYVTFIDGDDFYYNDHKLENEMNIVLKYKQECRKDVIAFSPVIDMAYDGETIVLKHQLKKRKHPNRKALLKMLAFVVKMPRDYCLSKELLCSVGAYNYPDNFYEDLDLLFRLAQKAEFYSTGDYGTAYRQTPNGLSKRSAEEHQNRVNSIRNHYYEQLNIFHKAVVKTYELIEKIRVYIWNLIHLRKGMK